MGNIPYNPCVKFYCDRMRIDGALGFFQRASPPNNNNNNNNNKISSVWGPCSSWSKNIAIVARVALVAFQHVYDSGPHQYGRR